ncbi:MAG TPA: glycosyltransferase family 2 protein [Pyrinomonadaceae bacterium]|nr:glycosyltransferase family 2 protein [Pyrinomonadaceae bacterium]
MLEHAQATVADYETEPRVHTGGTGEESLRAAATAPPRVSVVIPCFNEERYIGKVLANLLGQYEPESFEIIIVDGMSEDGTRAEVSKFTQQNPQVQVRLVDNPARHIPAALNRGIEAARGELIVRMDAHSVPSVNYVRRLVELLDKGEAEVCGMPWRIEPGAESVVARAIALAVSHPFGIGDARYRNAGLASSEFVDTVPFGAFAKSLWREVGGFNEELLANEDYDFYYRIRRGGGRVLLDAQGYSSYYARPTLTDLARQYFRYGRWKAAMLKEHPRSVRLRQLVAPVFVLSILSFGALGIFWTPALLLLLLTVASYSLLAATVSVKLAIKGGDFRLAPVLPVVFFIIHSSWGSGFLLSVLRSPRG